LRLVKIPKLLFIKLFKRCPEHGPSYEHGMFLEQASKVNL